MTILKTLSLIVLLAGCTAKDVNQFVGAQVFDEDTRCVGSVGGSSIGEGC